ncbi:protein translocase subunit secB [Halanaerobium congolense]|jgi:preprotein translocase subunit SecB|uniref:Protein translocase subunit secB n=1 Tax=Halanaerobium congolense TaxID=54121 RepID=A0A1H9ZTU3_9FIRM|nr:protein-export chaperone SecB [Halanaerobium congolense]PTX16410.1 protein translocase subunit secB [Halanaerobium congolense]SDF18311.1 protein translocase subunit secB [Halanaerobium congolense]SES85164.1 protein translocase subunit secB [Halanaerobium congolense]SFO94611.1 protein translocase subunit secB [Halanaerobium congolense]
MNKNKSVLEFDSYYIDEFVFKKNENFTKDKNQKIDVDLNFEFDTERNQDNFKRIVTCYIFDENYVENNKPFYLKLKINGIFFLADYDENNRKHKEIIKKNTLAILFPYIRSIISHMTLEMQVGPVQMPPMNINHFFDEEKRTIKY